MVEISNHKSKYFNSEEILEQANSLEVRADGEVGEMAEILREKSRELRGAAALNRTLRDFRYVGSLLSLSHYELSSYE